MRILTIGLFLLSSAALEAQTAPEPAIDTAAIRIHTRFLADDLLEGRATGTPGVAIAARYLRAACGQLGLPAIGDSYLLPFDLVEATVDTAGTALIVSAGNVPTRYSTPEDFILDVGRYPESLLLSGPAVFVGDAAAVGRDSAAAPPADAVAVVDGLLRPDVASRLAGRGFAAAIYVAPNRPTFDLYRRSRGPTRLAHREPDVVSSFLPSIPTVIAAPGVAEALVRGARRGAGGLLTLDARVTLEVRTDTRGLHGENVACLLPGRDSTLDAVAYTAHYDHLGVSEPDAAGDSIYNGFSDNAAGVAMLLAIADAHRRLRPRRPMLFLFFSGEERGLLGSDAFVHEPPWPLDRIAGVINLDAGAPPAPPTSWRIAGGERSRLGDLAITVAASHGWHAEASAASPNTDYYPFWRRGVPAIFIVPGTRPYDGLTADQSAALKDRWDRYHQPDDHWAAEFPLAGLERYARYAWRVGRALDRRQGRSPRP